MVTYVRTFQLYIVKRVHDISIFSTTTKYKAIFTLKYLVCIYLNVRLWCECVLVFRGLCARFMYVFSVYEKYKNFHHDYECNMFASVCFWICVLTSYSFSLSMYFFLLRFLLFFYHVRKTRRPPFFSHFTKFSFFIHVFLFSILDGFLFIDKFLSLVCIPVRLFFIGLSFI